MVVVMIFGLAAWLGWLFGTLILGAWWGGVLGAGLFVGVVAVAWRIAELLK